MECYLDHAATTWVDPEVLEAMGPLLAEVYGNPSSLHRKGHEAERIVETAREGIAQALKASAREIYFTSGGTESNNLAILGIARAYRRQGNHIITTAVEHPSVLGPAQALEEEGFTVTKVPVDRDGRLDLEAFEAAITPQTVLASAMHVNNETGVIHPVAQMGKILKGMNPKAFFHVDGVQSLGKIPLSLKQAGVDALSGSGHKVGAPKGVGFLYLRQGVRVKPLAYGGSQQRSVRPGTEPVPGIWALHMALGKRLDPKNMKRSEAHAAALKKLVWEGLNARLGGLSLNGLPLEHPLSCPYILNFASPDVKSEVVLHALEARGIYVSTGAACASNKANKSGTLEAMGRTAMEADRALRISFSPASTVEEAEHFVDILSEILPELGKFVKK
ncbi:cysteine desulfurase family protein [Anaerotalea alkaliphila]|uniref:Cysteine desulfurase n=1 Tax=Anaerotalea alkaliphila TaxID=2662126 RepID=A0A7X5HX12_9FIRM|nr:cysteine desulfurase family protein [Anaerotalea alkaliphila]NDL68217.1 cysteine desulfurase [Anaerotalea alkaliphila]